MIKQDFLDRVDCMEDITYKTIKGLEMKLDLYRQKGKSSAKTPVLFLLHGGGWFRQDKRHEVVERFLNYLGDEVINKNGWQIAAVEYRLRKDGAEVPDQLCDCCDAVRFLINHAEKYAVDANNILVGGSSAGGYAASMMALETHKFNDAPELAQIDFSVAAAVSFSGIIDVPYCVRAGDEKNAATGDGRLRFCMECLLTKERLYDKALQLSCSPREYLHAGSAPMLLIYGTADSLIPPEHAEQVCAQAVSMGLPWEQLAVINAEHNFAPWTAEEPAIPDARTVYVTARDFLLKHVRPQAL